MTKMCFKQWAFTIIEMMIVFCVIAALAVIVFPHILRAKMTTNHVNAKATLKSIGTALEAYAADHSSYPEGVSYLLGTQYPYLTKNYFEGEHCGYVFSAELKENSYTVVAEPMSAYAGIKIFTMTTGIVFSEVAAEE